MGSKKKNLKLKKDKQSFFFSPKEKKSHKTQHRWKKLMVMRLLHNDTSCLPEFQVKTQNWEQSGPNPAVF